MEQVVETKKSSPWKFWTQKRYILTFMMLLATGNMFIIRTNLSVTIIAMTNNRTAEDGTVLQVAEFDWDSKQQGIALSSFYYGSIITQLPGGMLTQYISPVRTYGIAIGVASVLQLLTPIIAVNFSALVILRTIQGLVLGVTFPTAMAIMSRWAPPLERTRMMSISNSGIYFGTVIALQGSGILCDFYGWKSVFYIFGIIGVLWFIVWMLIINDNPDEDKNISETERKYIIESIGSQIQLGKIKTPWLSIFASIPFWGIAAAHFAHTWGGYFLMTQMPTFLSDIFGFQLTKTGFFSCLPYLLNGILSGPAGYLADFIIKKNLLTMTHTRKSFTCTALLIQGVLMLGITLLMSPAGSITFLTLSVGICAFATAGYWVNFIDIAPQLSGILFALSNTFATIPGIMAPMLTGFIVQNKSENEWKIMFYICAAVYLGGTILYGLMASSELQPWARGVKKIQKDVSIELQETEKLMINSIQGK